MMSTRPYLIRAIYEWAQDNNLTPHLLVDTTQKDVDVPRSLIEDNKIILNIAENAVANLSLGDDYVTFSARFAGIAREIFVPTTAVRAIYAKENGMGIVLPDEPAQKDAATPERLPQSKRRSKGAHLKVIQ